jgi:hypothetical protein
VNYVVAVVVGLAFGAGDQYLGTVHATVPFGPWTVSVSQMAALWVLLPFLFGCTQDEARRGVVLGIVATGAGLFGYWMMTVSPMEGVALGDAPRAAAAWFASNTTVLVGGLITAPLFGYLGHRWRSDGWWVGPALLSAAFLLEPILRRVGDRVIGPSWVWAVEFAVGLCLAAGFAAAGAVRRRHVVA